MLRIINCEQNSEEWIQSRVGLPTASEFSKLVTGTGKPSTQISDYAATLAAEVFAGKPLERWEGSWVTERGHEVEPIARANYEFLNDVQVLRVGFVMNLHAGCSPDGLVGDSGLHEIKSQLPKGHVQTLAYYRKHGKCPPGYFPQVQGQLLICEREWCDLDFFHPELPGLTVRVHRDEPYIKMLQEQICAVNDMRDELVAMLREAA